MYKLILSKQHGGKTIQHFSEIKSNIDAWVRDLLETHPDEVITVIKVEERIIEVHKGSKA